ncbi:hypothetical protein SAMN03080614_102033, partial [Anaerobranca gottschalkii DSM 13577]
MLPQFITYCLEIIKQQNEIICTLITLLIKKSVFNKPSKEPVNKPYRKLQVDELPVVEKL